MTTHSTEPVRVYARLDSPLSRWLWLVKWLLALPHYLILALLWITFVVLTVVAFVAILVTGRYPRVLFDFNVGVLRWAWRVHYYTYAALGTDRYPPFTLADVPDYPARLDIDYPERLSRGLVLVKWLLAIPHYLVVGLFVGGGLWYLWDGPDDRGWAAGGLVGLLVFIAAVVLLFTGNYPKPIFDFVLGMDRWVVRVGAYVGLMTDRYPPFRLDLGGEEPGMGAPDSPTAPPSDTGGARGWTTGRVVSVVVGALVAFAAVALLVGGAVALWADRNERDADGYLTTSATLATDTYALRTEPMRFPGGVADRVGDGLGDVRVSVTPVEPDRSVFLGIASARDAARYLAGTEHAVVRDVTGDRVRTELVDDGGRPAPPESVDIWVDRASGSGTQTIHTTVSTGDWVLVVVDQDQVPGVSVRADVGATVPALPWVATTALVSGAVLLALAALPIGIAARRASRDGP
ncbi:DUF4389 domain-containing protein [Saccharomonospora azurea]|uniref:DUF4389 domain-containing protein n=1 Tax=Saccharomonospora azurea TaxID=40988 RepID=UPI003D9186BD